MIGVDGSRIGNTNDMNNTHIGSSVGKGDGFFGGSGDVAA